MTIKQNVRRFKQLDKQIDQSEKEAEAARWEQAFLAFEAKESGMTQQEYAEQVGCSQSHIQKLGRTWRDYSDPHNRPLFRDAYEAIGAGAGEPADANEARRLRAQRQVPEKHDDRVEMASKLMEDPDVVEGVLEKPTLGSRRVTQGVRQQNIESKQRASKANQQKAKASAVPMSAAIASIVVKMNDFSIALAQMIGELDSIKNEEDRGSVLRASRQLVAQAERWVDKLEGDPLLTVIDGGLDEAFPVIDQGAEKA